MGIHYDLLNRLVQVDQGVPGDVGLPIGDYAYDGEGSRLASHLSSLYSSNAHNQLLEDDSYTYAYDARGNRVSRTAKATGAVETYSYDSQNRLVGYASDTTTASYAYDAMDRRIAKVVDGAKTAYAYDTSMENPLDHDDIIMEFEAGTAPFLARRWAHSAAVDEPIGFEQYLSTEAPEPGWNGRCSRTVRGRSCTSHARDGSGAGGLCLRRLRRDHSNRRDAAATLWVHRAGVR